jgi:glycyl-tRNA synthetase beta chain
MLDRGWDWSLEPFADQAFSTLGPLVKRPLKEARAETLDFFRARLKSHILSLGVSGDGAEAVLCLHGSSPLPSVGRCLALEALKKKEGFRDLAQTFKRVVNIIRKFGAKEPKASLELLTMEAEINLIASVKTLEEKSGDFLAKGDYAGLLESIAGLRGQVDDFFDHVLVDDPDPELKCARMALLYRTSRLFETIADFSRVSSV